MNGAAGKAAVLLLVAGIGFAYGNASSQGEKGFVSLFNGKDLTGWEGDPQLWSVRDGMIIGKHPMDKTTNRYLCTKEKYGDFILHVSWKLMNPKGNSGVQIRSDPKPNLLVAGFQVEIGGGNSGGIYEELGRGWMQKPSEKAKDLVMLDDWNHYVITAKGSKIEVQVNGVKVTELNDEKGRKKGVIALQHYQGEVQFKDIKLIKLSGE